MKPIFILVMIVGASSTAPTVRSEEAKSHSDFSSFQIIWERNIFNPNRYARSSGRPPPVRTVAEKPSRSESFALLGTMSYEKGSFAFFEGSSSQYHKVLEPSDTIAGYKIAEIASSGVKLETTNGQALDLPVGMQMKRYEEGEWLLGPRTDSSSNDRRRSSSDDRTIASSSGASGDTSEALKRLMQKRQEEAGGAPAETEPPPVVADDPAEGAEKKEKTEPEAAPGGTDDVLRKLMQKREQELNK